VLVQEKNMQIHILSLLDTSTDKLLNEQREAAGVEAMA
jgi:hypothetical protein